MKELLIFIGIWLLVGSFGGIVYCVGWGLILIFVYRFDYERWNKARLNESGNDDKDIT